MSSQWENACSSITKDEATSALMDLLRNLELTVSDNSVSLFSCIAFLILLLCLKLCQHQDCTMLTQHNRLLLSFLPQFLNWEMGGVAARSCSLCRLAQTTPSKQFSWNHHYSKGAMCRIHVLFRLRT